MKTKVCSKCGEERDLNAFRKSNIHFLGVHSICKRCKSVQDKNYRENNKKKIAKYRKVYRYSNFKKIQAQTRAYKKSNSEKISLQNKVYYKSNIERIKIQHSIYNHVNHEKLKITSKRYRLGHKEQIRAIIKKYRKTNKGKMNSIKYCHKRRALMLNAKVEEFSPLEVFQRDGYVCQICGKKTRPDYKNQFHPLYPNLDHIVPLSCGGEHSKMNTQCLCRSCNALKGNSKFGDQLRLFG